MSPFFSVIIPAFNREEYIEKTLNSVFNQSFKDYEIIVIDDGSTDSTPLILKKYQNRIGIINEKNGGPGVARNIGIKASKGKFIAFLDSDDIWFPWTLSTYFGAISSHEGISFVAGNCIHFSDDSDLKTITNNGSDSTFYPDYFCTNSASIWIGTCAVAIRKDLLLNVGGFTSAHINSEDSDLWLKLGSAQGFLSIGSPFVFAYRRHNNSAVSDARKSYEGAKFLLSQENDGKYPGGASRKYDRIGIITKHVRPVSLSLLKTGELKRSLFLYKSTFIWHLKLFRIKYLLGYLLLFLVSLIKGKQEQSPVLNLVM